MHYSHVILKNKITQDCSILTYSIAPKFRFDYNKTKLASLQVTLQEKITLPARRSIDLMLDLHLNIIKPADFVMTPMEGVILTLNILDLAYLSVENILLSNLSNSPVTLELDQPMF